MPTSRQLLKSVASFVVELALTWLVLLFVAETFTGAPGKYVALADTVRGFREVVEGKHDDLPEQAFYMVGGIEEAVEKAKRLRE